MIAIHGEYKARYVEEYFKLNSAMDMFPLFPNVKEVTESMGAFHAVVSRLGWKALSDRTMSLIAVGDGSTPRTAGLFALRSAWDCWSVDPALKNKLWGVRRLNLVPKKIEDAELPPMASSIMVAVHSHAPIIMRPEWNVKMVVAIPCCFRQDIEGTFPDEEYKDRGIWSPKNLVKIWRIA